MGDVVSSHLDESRRGMITAQTRDVMKQFGKLYEQQYAVALFNSVRYEIEGGGGTQPQLLHRKDPLAGHCIFSGSLYQYLEETRKWRSRFVSVANSYALSLYENQAAHDRGLQSRVTINCAGYKVLSSMEEYMDLINNSLPDVKAKVGTSPFIKLDNKFPLILWHPYARHHCFCVMTEKEQKKWLAVLRDCVRHSNNGLPEDCIVQTPAFTDSVRLYRQAKGHYGTWDMMCGAPPQILANLVMETLHPQLRHVIGPRLKGKMQQRQRNWMLICAAAYKQVLAQTSSQYEALTEACEAQRAQLDARLRTDMDQIITSKEHITNKIRALVLPKAEELLRTSIQPYINSILEALMEPTSRGFSEVRDVFFKELVEISKNSLNGGGKEKVGEQLERLSMLAFHPVKMQSCYEKMEQLNLEGLQQRFDVSSPSVFISRAQILMREQMDNAVYTFEQLLQQALGAQGQDDVCKSIQKCQDRVLKKYDYDSSTVRKKFFREALLQIIIPYMLQQLAPACTPELPRFQELIFEDLSRFLLVENMYEEVVLQSVTKEIMMAVKEAAVQRKHNLYRDSMILTSSDPNLHLLEENPPVDWAAKFGGEEPDGPVSSSGEGRASGRRRKQVVSMIHLDDVPLPYESCLEAPGVELIPEEDGQSFDSKEEDGDEDEKSSEDPKTPDSVNAIRGLINPVVEVELSAPEEQVSAVSSGTEATKGLITMEDGLLEEVTHVTTVVDNHSKKSPQTILQKLATIKKLEAEDEENKENPEEEGEEVAVDESPQLSADSSSQNDSGFQSLSLGEPLPIKADLREEEEEPTASPTQVEVHLV
ncbi:Niban-like protein 1 [Oryzias melastigma]|uniref:Niban-like protein 1 n=1 Tax=Oryzias melastigma TaxID=30732 RepID=A0A834EZB2_ORYME|nr:Niban-like protein 1 [Oryzias melastigma]